MKLAESKMEQIIPAFMREDKTVQGLCAAADVIIRHVIEKMAVVNLLENLWILQEEDLDYIAKEQNIDWYDTSYSREQKERIIKNYEKSCMFFGTRHAVENVTLDIFGENTICEWYEYAGEHKHFKVKTEFDGNLEKSANDYEKRLRTVKSFRSILDELIFLQKIDMEPKLGMAILFEENISV